jgi:hypothetical protein
MRIVRFYLESWQKGGTPSPSQSLVLLSPRIKRRQRIPKMEELIEHDSNDDDNDGDCELTDKEKARRKFYLKYRYPPTVKKLSVLCSNVLANNVYNFFNFFQLS